MERDQELHVDKSYLDAFNDGYTLAKELDMTTDSLNGINAGNIRMHAIRKGIEQHEEEIEIEQHQEKLREGKVVGNETPPTPEPNKDRDIELEP